MAQIQARPIIFVISDALGETAELVARAAASQFNSGGVEVRRIPYVNDMQHISAIVTEAAAVEASIIAYTLVLEDMRRHLESEAQARGIPVVDILGPMLRAIGSRTRTAPRLQPGLLRRLDEEYYAKVEAVEFAVRYDDGKDPRGIIAADVVLVGVSRTSKTPVSMYLAYKRIKTANVPLVPEVKPPDEVFQVAHKVVGLTVQLESLLEIRAERLKTLGLTAQADYARRERVEQELEYARRIMNRLGCPVVDVTNRAVEETASKVLELYQKSPEMIKDPGH